MTKRLGATVRAASLLLALTGCDVVGIGGGSSVSGHWSAVNATCALDATLTESGGAVTGGGKLNVSRTVQIRGTHHNSTVDLTISATGFADISFVGNFKDDQTVSGSLCGSPVDMIRLGV